jgi:AbrB family looped-hinge helix DNA binding protein
MSIAKVTTKGQITIPAETRKALGIEQGDQLLFEVTQQDEARIRVIKRGRLAELYGSLPPTRPYPGKEAVRIEVGEKLGRRLSQKGDKRG